MFFTVFAVPDASKSVAFAKKRRAERLSFAETVQNTVNNIDYKKLKSNWDLPTEELADLEYAFHDDSEDEFPEYEDKEFRKGLRSDAREMFNAVKKTVTLNVDQRILTVFYIFVF